MAGMSAYQKAVDNKCTTGGEEREISDWFILGAG